jgi:uncharacterized protein (DUF736 family)
MMIGKFEQDGDSYIGEIDCFALRESGMKFIPVHGAKEKVPDFLVTGTCYADDEQTYEIGAAWKKTSKASKPYLSVKLDGPTLPAPINCALIRQPDGSFGLVWNRKERDAEVAATETAA